jgi:hypothetical protein
MLAGKPVSENKLKLFEMLFTATTVAVSALIAKPVGVLQFEQFASGEGATII